MIPGLQRATVFKRKSSKTATTASDWAFVKKYAIWRTPSGSRRPIARFRQRWQVTSTLTQRKRVIAAETKMGRGRNSRFIACLGRKSWASRKIPPRGSAAFCSVRLRPTIADAAHKKKAPPEAGPSLYGGGSPGGE